MAELIETTNQIKQFVLYSVISLYFWFMSKRPPSFPQPSLRSGFGPRTSHPWQRAPANSLSWKSRVHGVYGSWVHQNIANQFLVILLYSIAMVWVEHDSTNMFVWVDMIWDIWWYSYIIILGYMGYVMIFMSNHMIFSNPYHQIRPTWSASPRLAAK